MTQIGRPSNASLRLSSLLLLFIVLSFAPVRPLPARDEQAHMDGKTAEHMVKVIEEESTFAKMQAAMALGRARVNTPAVHKALTSMLKDEYPPARASALYALGRSGNDKAAAPVISALKDKDQTVRIEACLALAELGAGASANQLPLDDKELSVRLAAIQAAERIGKGRLEAALAKRFRMEEDAMLRAKLLDALRVLGTDHGAPASTAGLADKDLQVQASALAWFTAHGELTAHAQVVPELQGLLKSPTVLQRRGAAEALAKIREAEAETELLSLCRDKDHTVRMTAARLLGLYGSAASRPALHTLHADSLRHVRRAASAALAEHVNRSKEALPSVEALAKASTQAKSVTEQMEGVWLFGHLRSQAGFPDILNMAIQDIPAVSKGKVQDEDHPFLKADRRLSSLVMWTIGRSKYAPGADLGMKYANAPGADDLRTHATRTLGILKHKPASPLLVRLILEIFVVMGEPMFVYDGKPRENAIWALGQIGDATALDALAKLSSMTIPMDSTANIETCCEILIRYKYSNKRYLNRMEKVIAKYSKNGTKAPRALVRAVAILTGKKPDLPPEKKRARRSDFFLRTTKRR